MSVTKTKQKYTAGDLEAESGTHSDAGEFEAEGGT